VRHVKICGFLSAQSALLFTSICATLPWNRLNIFPRPHPGSLPLLNARNLLQRNIFGVSFAELTLDRIGRRLFTTMASFLTQPASFLVQEFGSTQAEIEGTSLGVYVRENGNRMPSGTFGQTSTPEQRAKNGRPAKLNAARKNFFRT
jgi:hypothetical protein